MTRRALAIAGLFAALHAGLSSADETDVIRESVKSYVDAYNAGDAKRLADHWAENAVFISRRTGEEVNGREAIKREFTEMFADGPNARLEVFVDSVRLITKSVAIEDGTAKVVRRGEAPSESRYTVVYLKEDGQWRIDSVRETVLPNDSNHYPQLKELEWLIGEWVDEGDGSSIHTTCEWTSNKNFIVRSFKVFIEDRMSIEGTQVIGWDPAAGHIRSWIFDSQGGFGEGVWTSENDRWVIKATATMEDGKQASAVNILTKIDNDTMTWQAVNREVDGELLPNIDAVTVVRKPAAQ